MPLVNFLFGEDVGGVSWSEGKFTHQNRCYGKSVMGTMYWIGLNFRNSKNHMVTGIIEVYSPRFFLGDTSLSGVFFIVILVYRGVNVFCFNDLGWQTPGSAETEDVLLSKPKITNIPGVFLQKWRSEVFCCCCFFGNDQQYFFDIFTSSWLINCCCFTRCRAAEV